MNRIVAIGSQKGGVGKTTTVLNLGVALAKLAGPTLIVDLDPEGGLSLISRVRQASPHGVVPALKGECSNAEALVATRCSGLTVCGFGPARPEELATLEAAAVDGRLARWIAACSQGFAYTLLDAPAGGGPVSSAVLGAAHAAISVVNCQAMALKTMPDYFRLVQRISESSNPNLQLEGVLVSMFDKRSRPQRTLLKELRSMLPADVLFETVIPYAEEIEAASLRSAPVALMSGAPTIAAHYYSLALEMLSREAQPTPTSPGEDPARLF